MDTQERKFKEPKFTKFLNSYIADILIFVAGILTIILTFIVIYLLCRQSKLKTLVANVILHHAKTIEATDLKNNNCDSGIMKFLMILNLVVAVLMLLIKLRKSKVF